VTVTVDHDASYQAGTNTLEYVTAGGQEKTLRLDSNIRMIYNGGATSRGVAELLNLPRYRAKFVGKGNIYTTALVSVPEVWIIGAVSENDEKIYDLVKPTGKLPLKEQEYNYLRILLQGKDAIKFKDLSIGNVLSVYASDDGERLEIHVSTAIVDGIVEQVKSKDYGTAYVVSGTEYYQPVTDKNGLFAPGDSVTMYLDVNGEIAYMKAGKGNGFAAFLIRGAQGDETFSKTLKIHLLGQDGIIATKECQEKVVIDGVPYKDSKKALRALSDEYDVFKPQIALITYNSKGEISSIDTSKVAPGESEYTLSLNVPYRDDSYTIYKWFGQIGPMSPVDDATVFFGVPDDTQIATAEDEDFTIVKKSDFVNDRKYPLETYKTVPKSEIEQYVVLKGYTTDERYTSLNPVLAKGLGTMMDAEGNQVESLEGFLGTEEVSIPAEEGFSLSAMNIEEGDLVRIRQNANGEIDQAEKVIDLDTIDTAQTSETFNNGYRFVVGYVHDIVGSVIKIAETDPKVPTYITYGTGIPVLIYDATERKPIRVGEINDANTWYNAAGECSRVVLLTKTASPQLMVIYK